MQKIQFKNARIEFKSEPDDDGFFEGYASVFGIIDQGMDTVERGAFVKSLSQRKPKMLWQHDTDDIIGVWEEVKEDERGLFVRGRVLKDVNKGREAIALLKAGAIDSMSIGYRVVEAVAEGAGRVRKLLELELFEISLVTFPMLLEAQVTSVKSLETERDFEKFLRDAGGLSRKEAKAVCAKGFNAIKDLRDAEDDGEQDAGLSGLLQSVRQLSESINNGN